MKSSHSLVSLNHSVQHLTLTRLKSFVCFLRVNIHIISIITTQYHDRYTYCITIWQYSGPAHLILQPLCNRQKEANFVVNQLIDPPQNTIFYGQYKTNGDKLTVQSKSSHTLTQKMSDPGQVGGCLCVHPVI